MEWTEDRPRPGLPQHGPGAAPARARHLGPAGRRRRGPRPSPPPPGQPRRRPRVVLVMANLPATWVGQMVDRNLRRDEDLPELLAARRPTTSTAEDHDTRVLELPGTDFAAYRWGNTVDPITPGLIDRPYVARELIPLRHPGVGQPAQRHRPAVAGGHLRPRRARPARPADRRGRRRAALRPRVRALPDAPPRDHLGADALGARAWTSPIPFGRAGREPAPGPAPAARRDRAGHRPGPGGPAAGGRVPRERRRADRAGPADRAPDHRVRRRRRPRGRDGRRGHRRGPGDLLQRRPARRRRAPRCSTQALADGADVVITDSNRRRARRWGAIRENEGYTEMAGEEALEYDVGDARLDIFPDGRRRQLHGRRPAGRGHRAGQRLRQPGQLHPGRPGVLRHGRRPPHRLEGRAPSARSRASTCASPPTSRSRPTTSASPSR